MTSTPPMRKSCDTCFKLKIKCNPIEGSNKCARCHRRKMECTYSCSKPIGRKPKSISRKASQDSSTVPSRISFSSSPFPSTTSSSSSSSSSSSYSSSGILGGSSRNSSSPAPSCSSSSTSSGSSSNLSTTHFFPELLPNTSVEISKLIEGLDWDDLVGSDPTFTNHGFLAPPPTLPWTSQVNFGEEVTTDNPWETFLRKGEGTWWTFNNFTTPWKG
ncbi:hypothetical protein IE53DRAFT_413278 [Violaceomyces palustris]|uniref:Uncharacterized protein n=1 Tax=Violaceomyces palustris TaxID=1673888 RepID=A0ACD0NMP8_9BASI|nr:hypothetical protein IE53DRAFT_413278 [Violaceomyces palustris]